MRTTPQTASQSSMLHSDWTMLAGMGLGLAVFYGARVLPLMVIGLAIFGILALRRPQLALLFVPLSVPLYLIPASLPGIRPQGFLLPLHEVVLLVSLMATLASGLWRSRVTGMGWRPDGWLWYIPHLLFLLAGVLGSVLAVERAPALREFRWLIAEPLIFYGLLLWAADRRHPPGIITMFILGGALVGLLGLLQYAGLDLVPLLGRKQCFAPNGNVCPSTIEDGGLRRVLSVYGHPNNLGLYLGRVWPIAAALALADMRGWSWKHHTPAGAKLQGGPGTTWLPALAALLCLDGIVVSFSRGAWLGALAAGMTLALGMAATSDQAQASSHRRHLSLIWLLALVGVAGVSAGLVLTLRGDVTAGSTPVRLLLWREALGYIRQHPFGIGLDQFGHYHNPTSGLSLIDPALIGSSEQYAAHPHNLVLDIWLRLGPLGLIACIWLIGRAFRQILIALHTPPTQSYGLTLGLAAALVAALVHGLVDNFYFVPDLALAFWMLIALSDRLPGLVHGRADATSGARGAQPLA